LARRRKNYRARHDAQQHENAPALEARDMHQSTPLAVDDPKEFYRDLTALDNVLCSEHLE